MKTKQYILAALISILSVFAVTLINTVTPAYAEDGETDHCIAHPEDCDPCLNSPADCECQNGATNYPDCDNYCTNGATNYPECTFTCSNGATNYPECTFTCSNGATNYPECTFTCANGATNYPYCTYTCSNGATNYPICTFPPKDPCILNPNLPQCKKNPCPNGVQSLSYCSDKPGEQAACEAIAQREANNKTGSCVQCEGRVCKVQPPKPPCGDGTCSFDERCTCSADCGTPLPGVCSPIVDPVVDLTGMCKKKTFLEMPNILEPGVFSDLCTLDKNTFNFSQSSYENNQTIFTGLCMPSKIECKYTINNPIITDPIDTTSGTGITTSGTSTTSGGTDVINKFSISGVIITGGNPVGGITLNLFKTTDTNLTTIISTTTTKDDGTYIFTDIATGNYTVVPTSTDTTIFIKTSTVDVTNTNITNINFNAITTNDPNFNNYVDLVTKNQITSGTTISDWLTDILGNGRNQNITSGTGLSDTNATATLTGTNFTVIITDGGSGYKGTPLVTLTGGECSVLPTAIATLSNGSVSSITVTGGECSVLPTISISSPTGGAGKTATAILVANDFSTIITEEGDGYISTPEVTLVGGVCSEMPTAKASVSGGSVRKITITGGSCTVLPKILIAAPTRSASLSNLNGKNANSLSSNSILSLLEKGYTLESSSYSPIGLSLLNKLLNPNAICGNGKIEEGETCDAGKENGTIKCSSDCLYIGEVRSTNDNGLLSNSLDQYNSSENYNRGTFSGSLKTLNSFAQKGKAIASEFINGVGDVFGAGADALDSAKEATKDFIVAHTSKETRAIMKKTAEVAVVAAQYSVIGVTTLLGVTAASLNIMVFKSQWQTYTIQEGDDMESISSRFNMTERAIRQKNGKLKKGALRPGMKIRVKNRTFIEKDYLDQLKSVLTDSLKTKNGHMAEKIEKMFAKK